MTGGSLRPGRNDGRGLGIGGPGRPDGVSKNFTYFFIFFLTIRFPSPISVPSTPEMRPERRAGGFPVRSRPPIPAPEMPPGGPSAASLPVPSASLRAGCFDRSGPHRHFDRSAASGEIRPATGAGRTPEPLASPLFSGERPPDSSPSTSLRAGYYAPAGGRGSGRNDGKGRACGPGREHGPTRCFSGLFFENEQRKDVQNDEDHYPMFADFAAGPAWRSGSPTAPKALRGKALPGMPERCGGPVRRLFSKDRPVCPGQGTGPTSCFSCLFPESNIERSYKNTGFLFFFSCFRGGVAVAGPAQPRRKSGSGARPPCRPRPRRPRPYRRRPCRPRRGPRARASMTPRKPRTSPPVMLARCRTVRRLRAMTGRRSGGWK